MGRRGAVQTWWRPVDRFGSHLGTNHYGVQVTARDAAAVRSVLSHDYYAATLRSVRRELRRRGRGDIPKQAVQAVMTHWKANG